jgi:hypothetical protein
VNWQIYFSKKSLLTGLSLQQQTLEVDRCEFIDVFGLVAQNFSGQAFKKVFHAIGHPET